MARAGTAITSSLTLGILGEKRNAQTTFSADMRITPLFKLQRVMLSILKTLIVEVRTSTGANNSSRIDTNLTSSSFTRSRIVSLRGLSFPHVTYPLKTV